MKGMIPPTVLLLLKLNKTAQPCRAFRGKGKHSELLPKRSCDAVPNTNTYGEGEREKREREGEREREEREREKERESMGEREGAAPHVLAAAAKLATTTTTSCNKIRTLHASARRGLQARGHSASASRCDASRPSQPSQKAHARRLRR